MQTSRSTEDLCYMLFSFCKINFFVWLVVCKFYGNILFTFCMTLSLQVTLAVLYSGTKIIEIRRKYLVACSWEGFHWCTNLSVHHACALACLYPWCRFINNVWISMTANSWDHAELNCVNVF